VNVDPAALLLFVGAVLFYFALRTRATTYENYDAYLRSPVWQRKRQQALQRDGYRCRVCDSADQLHVHHRRYPRVLGTETLDDLTVLCSRCHALAHETPRYTRRETVVR
jgi:5-methylcytosine-specific restriction endonuclease McrA